MNRSSRTTILFFLALCLGGMGLSGCGPIPENEDSNGLLATPTLATAVQTSTPREPASLETFTPSPDPTETPAATLTGVASFPPAAGGELSRSGPWLVYQAENRLWAANADGSGRNELLAEPLDLSRELVSSPPGTPPLLAMVVSHAGFPEFGDATLRVLEMPEGRIADEIDLMPFPASDEETEEVLQSRIAVASNIGMSWSPSGRFLAFVGMIDGPSADVYLYDSQTGEIRRLTDEPQQASALTWSPDEEWIAYQTVESFGTGAGWTALGLWAVPVEGGPARQLFAGRQQVYAGWTDQGELVAYPWDFGYLEPAAVDSSVQAVDPESGTARVLFSSEEVERGAFVAVAFLSSSEDRVAVAVATDAGEDRLLLIPIEGGPAETILTLRSPDLPRLEWSEELGRLLVAWEDEVMQFSSDGELELSYPERALPVVSPDGAWLAFFTYEEALDSADPGLRLYRPNGEIERALTDLPTTSLLWQPHGRTLFSVAGEQLLASRLPSGETRLIQENMPEFDFLHSMTWVGIQ